jgi:aminoglycoside 2'-N-acetyltransferase I
MGSPMQVDIIESDALDASVRDEILTLCRAAYEEELTGYLEDIGPGTHWLGRVNGTLASHLVVVDRWVQVEGLPILRTAYVELVATHPNVQRRGHATQLMRAMQARIGEYDLGGLSPSDEAFELYERLGWQWWKGPLVVREARGLVPSPDEELMILRLPRTPAALDLGAPLSIEWRAGEVW